MTRKHAVAALLLGLALALTQTQGAAGQSLRAEEIRVPFPREDGSLTPYTFELGYPLMTLVYDTVMWRDGRGVPRPWLARSVRRRAGNRELAVTLRKGVRWHDGEPLTAADVAFSLRFVADHPHPRFSPQLRAFEDVRVLSGRELLIRLKRPALGFEDQPLSDLPIFPEHLWRDLPPGRLAPPGLPVGSGPYRLVAHERGRSYSFAANRRYFLGRPAVSRIEVPIVRRPEATFQALRRRRVDAIPVSLTPAAARDLSGFGVSVASGPSYLGTVLMLNTRRPPFDEASARRAVADALDLTSITRSLGGLAAQQVAVPADHGNVHPGSPWAPRAALHRFRGDAARVAATELGLPPVRVLAARNDPQRLEAGRQVVIALRRAGIRATLREVSADGLARAVGQDSGGPSFQAAIWSSPPLASYDPTFLRAMFGGPDAPLNYSGYRSARFERLADTVDAAPTRADRRRAVAAELRLLARDAPVVPLFFADGQFAFRPASYGGWRFVRGTGLFDKQSFLPRRSHAASTPPIGDPIDRSQDSSGSPFLLAAAGLIGLLVLAAGVRALLPVLSRGSERR